MTESEAKKKWCPMMHEKYYVSDVVEKNHLKTATSGLAGKE